jgi:deazaflavin-dependent oxidoreductase (nitroreductase family)
MSGPGYRAPDLGLLGAEHVARYRETGGEVGYEWNGVPTLLLDTVGRRTGEPRTCALIFGRDGADHLVVASKGGAPEHPQWYRNLLAHPEAEIQVRAQRLPVVARTATGDERARLWAVMTGVWPNYDAYQARTERVIPLVVLSPAWAERAADRSPAVQRSRSRSIQQMQVIVEAAKRLVVERGSGFTTQELARTAGVAMQTFYRYFPGKDQLILAVIEDMVAEQAAQLAEVARELPDPLARLRRYVLAALSALDAEGAAASGPRFITAEHWRLQQLYPRELAQAIQPFTDLIAGELRAAEEAGLVHPADVDADAALVTRLLIATFHHHAFAGAEQPSAAIGEHVWAFCLTGLGGTP